jgi:hypothetical protein
MPTQMPQWGQFSADVVTVFIENGQHLVMTPDGNVLILLSTEVIDIYAEVPTVTAKFYCNIAENREDAIAKYKKAKEK